MNREVSSKVLRTNEQDDCKALGSSEGGPSFL